VEERCSELEEEQSFIEKVEDKLEEIGEIVEQKIEAVEDAVEQKLDQVEDAVEDYLGLDDDECEEIEFDDDDVQAYIVDEDDNEIGVILLDEEGNEVEYYYVDDDEVEQGATSPSKKEEKNPYDFGITKESVADATSDMNAIYRDGAAVANELKGAYDDIMAAFDFTGKRSAKK